MADSRVTTWTEITDLDGTEAIAVDDGGNKKLLTSNIVASRSSTKGGEKNLSNDPAVNTIDGDVDKSVNMGAGGASWPNRIGAVAKPQGSDNSNGASWPVDSAYPSGSAGVATILGGYDHINNQEAGAICGGGHNYIQYNAAGHSFIGGGSYNWIQGYRSSIFGGRNNAIFGETSGFTVIGGGDGNQATGSYIFIGGGSNNQVSSVGGAVPSGNACTISGSSDYSFACGNNLTITDAAYSFVSGNGNQATGNYNFCAGGNANTLSGVYSSAISSQNSNDNGADYALIVGNSAGGYGGSGSLVQSPSARASAGDSQSGTFVQRCTANDQNQASPNGGENILLPAGKTVAMGGSVYISAINSITGAGAAWELDLCITSNGVDDYRTNGSSGNVALNAIYNPEGLASPVIAVNSGVVRFRGYGKAGEPVHFSAMYKLAIVSMDNA